MKNLARLIILVLLSSIIVSCSLENNTKTNTLGTTNNDTENVYKNSENNKGSFNDSDSDTNEIDNNYKSVDKTKLDYNNSYSSNTYYETKESFVGSEAGIPKINNKKYEGILKDYTYASEVNPTRMPYNEAVKLAKSILPDDIKAVQKKYDKDTSTTYISYSSSQGNFVVGFCYDYDNSQASGFNPDSDNEIIVGIDYLKEISE